MNANEYFFTQGDSVYRIEQWQCLRGSGEQCQCPKCLGKQGFCADIPECKLEKVGSVSDCIPDDSPGFGLECFFERWDR